MLASNICQNLKTFLKDKKLKQESFNTYFAQADDIGEDKRLTKLRMKNNSEEGKSFWQHKLHSFQLDGLNVSEVPLFYCSSLSFFGF